jgi:uncharacterized transporter YbjL
MLFIIIFFILGALIFAYTFGIVLVVLYEWQMQKIYKAKKKEMEKIKNMRVSMAAVYAKTFKVEQDYKKIIEILNRKQKEILKKLPYLRQAYL